MKRGRHSLSDLLNESHDVGLEQSVKVLDNFFGTKKKKKKKQALAARNLASLLHGKRSGSRKRPRGKQSVAAKYQVLENKETQAHVDLLQRVESEIESLLLGKTPFDRLEDEKERELQDLQSDIEIESQIKHLHNYLDERQARLHKSFGNSKTRDTVEYQSVFADEIRQLSEKVHTSSAGNGAFPTIPDILAPINKYQISKDNLKLNEGTDENRGKLGVNLQVGTTLSGPLDMAYTADYTSPTTPFTEWRLITQTLRAQALRERFGPLLDVARRHRERKFFSSWKRYRNNKQKMRRYLRLGITLVTIARTVAMKGIAHEVRTRWHNVVKKRVDRRRRLVEIFSNCVPLTYHNSSRQRMHIYLAERRWKIHHRLDKPRYYFGRWTMYAQRSAEEHEMKMRHATLFWVKHESRLYGSYKGLSRKVGGGLNIERLDALSSQLSISAEVHRTQKVMKKFKRVILQSIVNDRINHICKVAIDEKLGEKADVFFLQRAKQRGVKRLAFNANLLKLLRYNLSKAKGLRRKILFQRWREALDVIADENFASIIIQKTYRGYKYGKMISYRKQRMKILKKYKEDEDLYNRTVVANEKASTVQRCVRSFLAKKRVNLIRIVQFKARVERVRLDALQANKDKENVIKTFESNLLHRFHIQTATKIQAWYRAEVERNSIIKEKKAIRHMEYAVVRRAASIIQSRFKGYHQRRVEKVIRLQAFIRGRHACFFARKTRKQIRLNGEVTSKKRRLSYLFRKYFGVKSYDSMETSIENMELFRLVKIPKVAWLMRKDRLRELEGYDLKKKKHLMKNWDKIDRILFKIELATIMKFRQALWKYADRREERKYPLEFNDHKFKTKMDTRQVRRFNEKARKLAVKHKLSREYREAKKYYAATRIQAIFRGKSTRFRLRKEISKMFLNCPERMKVCRQLVDLGYSDLRFHRKIITRLIKFGVLKKKKSKYDYNPILDEKTDLYFEEKEKAEGLARGRRRNATVFSAAVDQTGPGRRNASPPDELIKQLTGWTFFVHDVEHKLGVQFGGLIRYTGNWLRAQPDNGTGSAIFVDTMNQRGFQTISGTWENGLFCKQCEIKYIDGSVYNGEVSRGSRHGQGQMYFPSKQHTMLERYHAYRSAEFDAIEKLHEQGSEMYSDQNPQEAKNKLVGVSPKYRPKGLVSAPKKEEETPSQWNLEDNFRFDIGFTQFENLKRFKKYQVVPVGKAKQSKGKDEEDDEDEDTRQRRGAVVKLKHVEKKKVAKRIGEHYEGSFADDQIHGDGIFYYDTRGYYKGAFVKGKRQGNGKLVCHNEWIYEGEFFEDKRHGKGLYQEYGDNENGFTYEGSFKNDRFHGEGELRKKHTKYVGSFVDGLRHGTAWEYYFDPSKDPNDRSGITRRRGVWEKGELKEWKCSLISNKFTDEFLAKFADEKDYTSVFAMFCIQKFDKNFDAEMCERVASGIDPDDPRVTEIYKRIRHAIMKVHNAEASIRLAEEIEDREEDFYDAKELLRQAKSKVRDFRDQLELAEREYDRNRLILEKTREHYKECQTLFKKEFSETVETYQLLSVEPANALLKNLKMHSHIIPILQFARPHECFMSIIRCVVILYTKTFDPTPDWISCRTLLQKSPDELVPPVSLLNWMNTFDGSKFVTSLDVINAVKLIYNSGVRVWKGSDDHLLKSDLYREVITALIPWLEVVMKCVDNNVKLNPMRVRLKGFADKIEKINTAMDTHDSEASKIEEYIRVAKEKEKDLYDAKEKVKAGLEDARQRLKDGRPSKLEETQDNQASKDLLMTGVSLEENLMRMAKLQTQFDKECKHCRNCQREMESLERDKGDAIMRLSRLENNGIKVFEAKRQPLLEAAAKAIKHLVPQDLLDVYSLGLNPPYEAILAAKCTMILLDQKDSWETFRLQVTHIAEKEHISGKRIIKKTMRLPREEFFTSLKEFKRDTITGMKVFLIERLHNMRELKTMDEVKEAKWGKVPYALLLWVKAQTTWFEIEKHAGPLYKYAENAQTDIDELTGTLTKLRNDYEKAKQKCDLTDEKLVKLRNTIDQQTSNNSSK
eukprot:g3597.t1